MLTRRYLLLGLAFALAIGALTAAALTTPGTPDVGLWLQWADNAARLGLRDGYVANGADYPPLSALALAALARAADSLGIERFTALKVMLLLCLLVTALMVWAWSRRPWLALATLAALALNSVALGYLDILLAPPLLLGLWALAQRRWALFSLGFALAVLVKWQPLIIAPFVGWYCLTAWRRPPRGLPSRLAAPVWDTALLVTPPLALGALGVWGGWGAPIVASLGQAIAHPYLSGNALNLNWLATHALRALAPDTFGGLEGGLARYILTDNPLLLAWSKPLFIAAYGLLLWRFTRAPQSLATLLRFALAGFLAYFTFNTGVHENHLFIPVLLGLALAATGRSPAPFAACAIALNINMALFYGLAGAGLPFSRAVNGLDLALPLAALVTLACCAVIARLGWLNNGQT